MSDYVATERLYLSRDGRVVTEGPDAAFLLLPVGDSMPEAKARELGLLSDSKAKTAAPANKARSSSPATKTFANPPGWSRPKV